MPRTLCRLTQAVCIALATLGLFPWALMCGALMIRAIESRLPLTMSVVAWMAMLVPFWVLWFGAIAWSKRNETAIPAMIMAAPLVICMGLFMLIPETAAAN